MNRKSYAVVYLLAGLIWAGITIVHAVNGNTERFFSNALGSAAFIGLALFMYYKYKKEGN